MSKPTARTFPLASLASLLLTASASAEDSPAQPSPRAGDQCIVQGEARIQTNLEIFDAESGGEAIARFTGTDVKLAVIDFPATTSGRVRVQTGTGTGSFRIEGYTDPAQIPLMTKREIPVVSGHVWLGKARPVVYSEASPGRLRVHMKLAYPIAQTFTAWADCSAFTLDRSTPPGFQAPGDARGFVLEKDELTLFDDPDSKNEVTTIYRGAESGVLFWSEKQRGPYVHVQYSADVVIDGWAKRRDLKALPRGETQDELWRVRTTVSAPPQLRLAGTPTELRTTKEISLRIKASDKAPVVGRIEADTDVLVVDQVVGFVSVLPKRLDVAPAGEHHFWADAKELGLAK